MKDRIILHSDMNSFYASVEIQLHPELKGKAMAVCGSSETRHGIVLAKTDPAKKAGVKTGMSNYQALELCPELIVCSPHYDAYLKYSKAALEIYARYTDLIESFGMDEAWLDVSGSGIFGDGPHIAEEIRKTIRAELGLTVSIGVSWNKIFAKLGSDMKKPDAVTVISRDNYGSRIWPLDVGELLYCGPASTRKLHGMGIRSIGQLAAADSRLLKTALGKSGLMLKLYAEGKDESRVRHMDTVVPQKSMSHGITCISDLSGPEEVHLVLLALAQDLGHRLRAENCLAYGVGLGVRLSDLSWYSCQGRLPQASGSPEDISSFAFSLYRAHPSPMAARQITLEVHDLIPRNALVQTSLFVDQRYMERRDRFEKAVDDIRERFGKTAVFPASLLMEKKIPHDGRDLVRMPSFMYV